MVTVMPRQQHDVMLGPMRGHMAPNSSPFKPTINKLSSQYLIQDHMSSHYMKLGTVKPAIDSKPPKSMMTSVKKRDQMKREAMAKQMRLFDFEKGMKHGSGAHSRHMMDSTYGSQRMLSATVTKTGHDEPRPQSVSSYYSERSSSHSYTSPRRPHSATLKNNASNPKSPRDRTQRRPDVLVETYSGDYLDRHKDRFKNTDTPFTPRLKKCSGKSYLSQSKHYAPPLVVHKETKRKVSPRKSHDDVSPSTSTSSLHNEGKSEKSILCDMEAQKKERDICRADKCLIANEEGQELLAMNHIRFLRSLMRRKYQLAAYLKLLDIHIEKGSVPPGLRIDITPPGYHEARCEGFFEWTEKTKKCSQDLVHLLRKRYVVDLKRLEQLMQCSKLQLTTIFWSLKGVTRECASFEVSELVGKIAQESNIALLESFDKAEVVSGKGFARRSEPTILHVSAGTDHRALKEDNDMMEERTRSLSRLSLDSRKTYDNIYPERNSYDGYGFRSGEGNNSFFGTSEFNRRISRNETFSSYTRNRIEAEEEEMKYLEFINSVTNDILTRGVYSDRVLTQVMERHLIQNKGKLDEGRMRHMLMKLQQDLGVSTSPLREKLEDSIDYSMRYEHPVLYDGDHHSDDLKERNCSRPLSAASSHKSSVTHSQRRKAGGDGSIPKPKKRGILKTSGVSSGSDIDRRSALSSGDEKEKDTKAQNLNLALDQPDPLLATMRMSPRIRKDSTKISNGRGHATSPERSSSIERDLNDVVSIKSNSGHSLGSSHSAKTSTLGNDSDDVLL